MTEAAATIVAGAATAVATVAAAVIAVKFTGGRVSRKDRESLSGSWSCRWNVVAPAERVQGFFEDCIEITVDRHGRITGRASNLDYGNYVVEGQVWNYAITLQFRATAEYDERVGVILLEKDVMNEEMRGEWSQLSRSKAVVRGECIWTRLTSPRAR